MKNLLNKIITKNRKEEAQFKADINEEISIDSILSHWFYRNLLTVTTRKKEWKDVRELKDYLIKRKNKESEKSLNNDKKHLKTISESLSFKSATITVEWKKSSTWRMNPTARVEIRDSKGNFSQFDSGSISGCGYDKLSTAIADVLNQSSAVLKPLYALKNKNTNTNKQNRDIFGYGSGYGLLPSIEGGVGVSCYPSIFKSIGYTFKNTASGNSFDVFTITKGIK